MDLVSKEVEKGLNCFIELELQLYLICINLCCNYILVLLFPYVRQYAISILRQGKKEEVGFTENLVRVKLRRCKDLNRLYLQT